MLSPEKVPEMISENDVAEIEHKGDAIQQHQATDPHDPLTWSLSQKLIILFIVGVWILLGTTNMIIIGPALQIVHVEFNSSFASSTYLIGGPLLAYGVASFIWVPLGNRYGVRLVFVVCALIAGCMNCWAAKATSFGSLVAARTLASTFYAPPETLAPQMVGDVFYLKDRAKAMSWIGILQASGFAGGPLVGSFIIQNEYAYLHQTNRQNTDSVPQKSWLEMDRMGPCRSHFRHGHRADPAISRNSIHWGLSWNEPTAYLERQLQILACQWWR